MRLIVLLLFGILCGCQGLPVPMGHYPLNSSTGANDTSFFKNPPGTILDASVDEGVYGQAGGSYAFSGKRSSPSYVRLTSSGPLDTRFSITLLTWVYPESSGGEIIFYWRNSNYGVGITLENLHPVFHVYSRDQTTKYSVRGGKKLVPNKWNHVAGSYDNTTGGAVVYLDGMQAANKTDIGSLELKTEYDLWLGYLFKGRLSQVWIFNVSLSEEEVNEVKDFEKPLSSSPSSSLTQVPLTSSFPWNTFDVTFSLTSIDAIISAFTAGIASHDSSTIRSSSIQSSQLLPDHTYLMPNQTLIDYTPIVNQTLSHGTVIVNQTLIYPTPTVNQTAVTLSTARTEPLNVSATLAKNTATWSSTNVMNNRSITMSSVTNSQSVESSVSPVGNFCRREPNLIAIIYGGAEIFRGLGENITMNASFSYDPDVGPGDHSGMNFIWRFGEIKGNYSTKDPFIAVRDAVIEYTKDEVHGMETTFDTTPLLLNKTYVVKLIVSKNYCNSSVFQVIRLVKGIPPKVSQRCLINCAPNISPSVQLSVQSHCEGVQCSKIYSYQWLLYQQNKSSPNTDIKWEKRENFQLLTSTSLNSKQIVIKANSLDGGMNYRLVLYVKTTDGLQGMSAYHISTASPPAGGVCTVTPSSGISLTTNFNLSCSDWISDVTPLTYQFHYQLGNGLYSVIYHGLNNSVISWLPPGNQSDNYKVNFVITVTDKYGASAAPVDLSVRVEPSEFLKPENITIFLTGNVSVFSQIVKDGDLNRAAQIANTLLQAVYEDSTLNSVETAKIQEFIIESIVSLQLDSIQDLLLTSSVIGSAIQYTQTVTAKSLKFSLPAIKTMASLLWNTAQLKDVANIPLISQSAKNLGSCLNSVLKAGAVIASGKFGSGLQEQGKNLVTSSMKFISTIGDAVLALKVPDEEMTSIKTKELVMTLGRHTPEKLAGLVIEGGEGQFVLPAGNKTLESSISGTLFVDTQMLSIPFNPFTWDDTKERVHSDVLALDLKDSTRKVIEVSNLTKDILISTQLKPQEVPLQLPQYFTQNDNLRFHQVYVEHENTVIMIEITPKETSTSLFVYIRYGQRPTTQVHERTATVSKKETCIWRSVGEKPDCSLNGLIETVARQPGRYFIGVQSYNIGVNSIKRRKRSCFGNHRQKKSCVQVKDPPPSPPESGNVTLVPVYDPITAKNYTLKVALGSCVYWSEKKEKWTAEGCWVLSALNGYLNCSCNHLTSFGGSLLVKPNPIDFDQVLVEFKALGDTGNVAVIVTVAVAVLCYFLVLVIVRKADKKDSKNNGLRIELSTASNNLHEYEIIVTTGIWRNSSTTAKVAMQIYGADESTGVTQLGGGEEPDRENSLFARGNTDIFVLRVDKPLGDIEWVRVGHDNSGNSPSWFLEEIIILDKETKRSWTFQNNQWLALERGDGRIERLLKLTLSQADFNKEVLSRWWKGLTDNHTWLSVVTKTRRNRFTRVQRASCCLSVLLTAMLANAMFYKLSGKSEQVLQIGPLKFSSRQVVVGIESALIVAPINILIAFLFRKGANDEQCQHRFKAKWFTYVAWFLFVCSCAVSATFTIFYSLVWGNSISEQWLSSMFISFVQDVAITEPVKVFFTAVLAAAIIRKKKSIPYGYESLEESKKTSAKGRLWALHLSEVEKMRRSQARQQNISRFLIELVVYLIFVFLLMVVCYGNRNDHRYMMTKSVRDGIPQFQTVFKSTKYWSWLTDVFLPAMFVGKWYNSQLDNQTIYIGNHRSLLVGMPRARQFRVKPKSCEVLGYMKHMFPVCYGAYSSKSESKTAFNKPGWKPTQNFTNKDELFRLCPKPWRYQDFEENTVPKWGQFSFYPGGGFVADLGYENTTGFSIIQGLKQDFWLDRQTRAVILEFSAFNPSSNLMVIGTYFYEIEASGYSAPFTRIEIFSLDSTETRARQFYLICILFFIIFVVLYLGRECYRLQNQRSRYLQSFWSWVEIFQVIFSVLAVVMYIVRSEKAVSTIQELQKNIYSNVRFQGVIICLEVENAVLGVLTFIVTAKLLRLIRFNQHVAVFSRTLKTSANLLSSFYVVVLIGFMAFLHFGFLTFGGGSAHYSTVLRAIYFQLELTLGRVKARPINELADANDTFGRIFAALLLLSLTIVAMNFAIAIMNDALLNAKTSVYENELFDLVDEHSCIGTGVNKKLFDAVSKSMRKMKIEEKLKDKEMDNDFTNVVNFSKCTGMVDFDLISKAIITLRQQNEDNSTDKGPFKINTRRKASFDKVRSFIGKRNRTSEDLNETMRGQVPFKHNKVRFSEDEIKFRLKKLKEQKRHLFQSLDSILEGHQEEEENFYLLCQEVAVLCERARKQDTGTANDSFA